MKEFTQIQHAVISTLQQADLPTFPAFPDQNIRRFNGPVAVVSVGSVEGKNLGFLNYLGETTNPETGSTQEVYGKHLEADISVDIRANSAAICNQGCESAADILLNQLPIGLKPGELSWETLCYERDSSLFLRRGHLRCQALFLATSNPDQSTFLDFILKGVLST